jgi:hypothetical protein
MLHARHYHEETLNNKKQCPKIEIKDSATNNTVKKIFL